MGKAARRMHNLPDGVAQCVAPGPDPAGMLRGGAGALAWWRSAPRSSAAWCLLLLQLSPWPCLTPPRRAAPRRAAPRPAPAGTPPSAARASPRTSCPSGSWTTSPTPSTRPAVRGRGGGPQAAASCRRRSKVPASEIERRGDVRAPRGRARVRQHHATPGTRRAPRTAHPAPRAVHRAPRHPAEMADSDYTASSSSSESGDDYAPSEDERSGRAALRRPARSRGAVGRNLAATSAGTSVPRRPAQRRRRRAPQGVASARAVSRGSIGCCKAPGLVGG
jgi:hypothetical protein